MKEPVKVPTLSERIAKRAKEMRREKGPPVIAKIIEGREAIADLRLKGDSWDYVVGVLKAESIHLSQGTLRNYMAKIKQAEAVLKDNGVCSPSIEQIRAVIWRGRSQKPSAPFQQPLSKQTNAEVVARTQSAVSAPIASTLSRDPKREL